MEPDVKQPETKCVFEEGKVIAEITSEGITHRISISKKDTTNIKKQDDIVKWLIARKLSTEEKVVFNVSKLMNHVIKCYAENKEWKESKRTVGLDIDLLSHDIDLRTIADRFVTQTPLYYDITGTWWLWNKKENKYEEIDEIDLLNDLDKVLDQAALLNNKIKNELFTALKMAARATAPKEVPDSWVQFKDCIYDLKDGEKKQVSNEYFLTTPIPHNLTEGETPVIDKLLNDWAPKQKELLKEVIAWCFVRNYDAQVLIWLIGSGLNGKGSYLRLIKRILGNDNITSNDFSRLLDAKNRFEIVTLYNKLVCLMGETDYATIYKSAKLKTLTGGDQQTAEKKGANNRLNFVNFAKLICASNSLPISNDNTDGFHRRQVIIKFNQKFEVGKEVSDAISEEELSNFCGELVKMAKEVYNKGRLINVDYNINSMREEYERLSNPIISFLETFYEEDPQYYVIKKFFIDDFKKYLKDNNKRVLSNKEITTLLKMQGFEERKKKIEKDYSATVIFGIKRNEKLMESNSTRPKCEVPAVPAVPAVLTPLPCIEGEVGLRGTSGTTGTAQQFTTPLIHDETTTNTIYKLKMMVKNKTFNYGALDTKFKEIFNRMIKEGVINEIKHNCFLVVE